MDERRLEAALNGLSEQRPRAPAKEINDMVQTVNALSRERAKRLEKTAAPAKQQAPVSRQRTLSTGKPVKDKKKTL